MYITTLISSSTTQPKRALALASHHARSKPRKTKNPTPTRQKSKYGTKAYQDALQRAFNNAKAQIFFNPDMQYFVTLTYAGKQTDIDKAMHDVKMMVKAERRKGHNLKYIYVFEWQKRGSLHIHMISNAEMTTYVNKNGYRSLKYWTHGYTSMLKIKDFDDNFKPYLYLFKYMRKAERIGNSYVHASRNLKNYHEIDANLIGLPDWIVAHTETTEVQFEDRQFKFYRHFMKHGIIGSQTKLQEGDHATGNNL